ncbi:HupE/UreJ family protein [Daejeonella oryzae]|uniref:HupE/UreJ family protein n=1 Tax=Daejeonella oryzae TaxID=1122943 RepID=UPI0004228D00|nr:HupE/UreJ family protein [Daejeonella oryzae]
MLSEFYIFLEQGFFHILDLQGYDHILFLLAICAIYSLNDWKTILWIITSFTIAHSLTLALSVLNFIFVSPELVEFLIAFTIFFTCLENLFFRKLHPYRMGFSFVFGLIHGMGFSRLLKDLFMGMEFNVLNTLLPFNLGLEAGQFIIILFIMSFLMILRTFLKVNKQTINYLISIPVLAQATFWMLQRWPF